MKTLTILLLTLLLTGCATVTATRDTWAGGGLDRLQSAHQSCIITINQAPGRVSPIVFFRPETAVVGAISYTTTPSRRTLYRECMERSGYTKLQSEQIPSDASIWGAPSRQFWVESPCSRQSNQTCMIESDKPKCPPPTVFFNNRCASEEQYRAHQEWIKSIPSPAFYKEERK